MYILVYFSGIRIFTHPAKHLFQSAIKMLARTVANSLKKKLKIHRKGPVT